MRFDPNGPNTQFNTTPLLFGFRAQDIAADRTRTPGLADSHFHAVFVNSAPGAPLPDLVAALVLGQTTTLQELISLALYANATGPLHVSAGLRPEGTPGRCTVTQTGVLFRARFKGATADGYPVERIELRRIGQ